MSAEFVVLFVACGSYNTTNSFKIHFHLIFLRKVLPIIDLSTKIEMLNFILAFFRRLIYNENDILFEKRNS